MTLEQLYQLARPIPEVFEMTNKYTFIGVNNILEVKYMDLNDILKHTTPINNYIREAGQVLLLPNKIEDKIINLFVLPFNKNITPLKLGSNSFPYNLGNLSKDFKYGDAIILVEGVADLAGLKLLDPTLNIVAMQSVSLPTTYHPLIEALTNKIILLNDSDNAGKAARRNTYKLFSSYGISVKIVEQYGSFKDTGEIVDKLMEYKKTHSSTIKEELEVIRLYYLSQLKEF